MALPLLFPVGVGLVSEDWFRSEGGVSASEEVPFSSGSSSNDSAELQIPFCMSAEWPFPDERMWRRGPLNGYRDYVCVCVCVGCMHGRIVQ